MEAKVLTFSVCVLISESLWEEVCLLQGPTLLRALKSEAPKMFQLMWIIFINVDSI